MILQLNPLIELDTEKGRGYALFLIDYGMDQDLYWTVALNDSGEIWTLPNNKVKAVKNYTLGREYKIESTCTLKVPPKYPITPTPTPAPSYQVGTSLLNDKDTHYHGCL